MYFQPKAVKIQLIFLFYFQLLHRTVWCVDTTFPSNGRWR